MNQSTFSWKYIVGLYVDSILDFIKYTFEWTTTRHLFIWNYLNVIEMECKAPCLTHRWWLVESELCYAWHWCYKHNSHDQFHMWVSRPMSHCGPFLWPPPPSKLPKSEKSFFSEEVLGEVTANRSSTSVISGGQNIVTLTARKHLSDSPLLCDPWPGYNTNSVEEGRGWIWPALHS